MSPIVNSGISFLEKDCSVFERYPSGSRWSEVANSDQDLFKSIRKRTKDLSQQLTSSRFASIPLKADASHPTPNGRSPRDIWSCVYPSVVPNKSYALQIALIISKRGAEVCFCQGANASQVADIEKRHSLEQWFDTMRMRLSTLPDELVATVEEGIKPAWCLRKSWLSTPDESEFSSFAEWLHYASDSEGSAASISRYFNPAELEEVGTGISTALEEMLETFGPVFSAVYGNSMPTIQSDSSPIAGLAKSPVATKPVAISPSHEVAYWWLNANPKIWDFRKAPVGTLQTYTAHNESGNKRQKFKHFAAVKPKDLLLGYVTAPDKEIVAICEITKGLHGAPGNEVFEFRKIEHFAEPVTWSELQALPALSECEPILNNQGSLFAIKPEEYDAIRTLIDERNVAVQIGESPSFTIEDALTDLFMSPDDVAAILSRLKRKKAIILQGPPGVGKTFAARRLAFALMGKRDERRVVTVQFHPSYSYEDFVQGFRPTQKGLERRDGIFHRFARLAKNDPSQDWFFIIDEINRGNLAKIFGELLMLIESDKRGSVHAIPLTYSEGLDETFHLPENIYFIGTMNTADRSLAMVDYALRRRFAFVTLPPAFESSMYGAWLERRGANYELIQRIRTKIGNLNELIERERDLGPGFRIGHSFFCPPADLSPDDAWYREVIAGEIRPLLEEYFDSRERVEELVAELLA